MGEAIDGGFGVADTPREPEMPPVDPAFRGDILSSRDDQGRVSEIAARCLDLGGTEFECAPEDQVEEDQLRAAEGGLRYADVPDQPPNNRDVRSTDAESPQDVQEPGFLAEIWYQSVADSVHEVFEFAERRLISLAADQILPVVGGRVVDLAWEIKDMVASVRALGSEEPVLEVPLPFSVLGLDIILEIPLTTGESGQAAQSLAVCAAPKSPSLTDGVEVDAADDEQEQEPPADPPLLTCGQARKTADDDRQMQKLPADPPSLIAGWSLDTVDDDGSPIQESPADSPEAALERLYSQRQPIFSSIRTVHADQPRSRAKRRTASACLVETDLNLLRLPRHSKIRAWALAYLAARYAPRLCGIPGLENLELLIITDKKRRFGLFIWFSADLETSTSPSP